MNLGFENQDKYESFEVYRKVQTILAGYFDEAPNVHGEPYPIPQSLSYDTMSAEKFQKWYEATLNVIAKQLETKQEIIRQQIDTFA